MGIEEIISTFKNDGCSPFFFTSALQSAIFGNEARKHQAQIVDSNIEFRERLQNLKDEYSRERIDAQLLFRRESYELGRQYLIQQTIAMNESRQRQADFLDFINHYWPLERSVYSVLFEHQKFMSQKSIVPLSVYIAKTELTSSIKNISQYEEFCEELIDYMQPFGVTVEKCPWKNLCQSRLSEAMNINYVMGGIPTLLVFPYQHEDFIGVETASWSFSKGSQSMNHSKALQIKNNSPELIPKITMSAVKAAIGMTRDAYMLAEYHSPVLFGKNIEKDILDIPEIRSQCISHYTDMSKLIGSSEFCQLCTEDELSQVKDSLNIQRLHD